ncbi:hypothetical protein [Streptomyces sp. NPDC001500]
MTGWPKYEAYRAPERLQDIALILGLPASTAREGVESLACAVERLRNTVGIEPSFQDLGIDERTILDALPQQALNAYEDQCAPANRACRCSTSCRRPWRWRGVRRRCRRSARRCARSPLATARSGEARR